MPFNWNDFISLATYLKDNCTILNSDQCIDEEATFRTIINRSYYAAFNVAKQFALKEFKTISRSGGEHESLIKTFRLFKNENPEYKNIATKLGRIKDQRVSADYHSEFQNRAVGNAAEMSLSLSQNIITTIDQIENQSVS